VHLTDAALVVLDGNLARPQAEQVLATARRAGVPVAFEPVSVAKAGRLRDLVAGLFLVTPNTDELTALTGHVDWHRGVADLHARGVEHVWVRQGSRGSSMCSVGTEPVHLPAVPTTVVDVTGAGDSALAAWVAAWLRGASPVEAAREGHRAAAATIASPHTVRPDLAEAIASLPHP